MLVTALLAYHYNWKYMYYFMMVLILISILFVIICFRHNRPIKGVAWSDLHIREMFVISAGLLMLMYVINYGKVLDWMASGKICAYIVIAPMLIALFIWYQSRLEESLCKSGSFVPAQSNYRLFLYDACDVFQYIDHFAD